MNLRIILSYGNSQDTSLQNTEKASIYVCLLEYVSLDKGIADETRRAHRTFEWRGGHDLQVGPPHADGP